MIPPEQYATLVRVVFGMLAVRRGAHWQLQRVPAEMTPFGEEIDEAKLLADSIAGIMKHVPLPTRELGIVGDITTAAIAFYSVLGPRMQIDAEIKRQVALARAEGRDPRTIFVAPATGPAEQTDDGAAATMEKIAGDGSPIRARVEHEPAPDRVQTGDPIADGVQLGHSVTAELGDREDPEPALFEAVRPGESPARVEDLATPGDAPLLDTIAPVPTVGGVPVERELP